MTLSKPASERKTSLEVLVEAHAKIKEVLFSIRDAISDHHASHDARFNPNSVGYDPRFDPKSPNYDSTLAALPYDARFDPNSASYDSTLVAQPNLRNPNAHY